MVLHLVGQAARHPALQTAHQAGGRRRRPRDRLARRRARHADGEAGGACATPSRDSANPGVLLQGVPGLKQAPGRGCAMNDHIYPLDGRALW